MFLLNIHQCLGDTEIESFVKDSINTFECPVNAEIEEFLKLRAMDFARRHFSITYLVFDDSRNLLGYFSLTHKNLYVDATGLSQTRKRRLKTFASDSDDKDLKIFNVSAFLIAQLGRNFAYNREVSISGEALMDLAMSKLREAQSIIGGGVVFLECEDVSKLLDFYQREPQNFFLIGGRFSNKDGKYYHQLVRFF